MSYRVAIDAGHGSFTAGKRTPDGYREHYINADVANYLDRALKRCGIETVKIAWNDTISTDDSDVALGTRQRQVKNANCELSVSCHANAHGNGSTYNSAQGIETLIHNNSAKARDSETLANKVQRYLIQNTSQKNRGVKTANLAMCNCAAMGTKASILVEIGFMTNQYEAELMKTDAFCLECAEEIAQGICDYLDVPYVAGNAAATPSATTNTSAAINAGSPTFTTTATTSTTSATTFATPGSSTVSNSSAYTRTAFIREMQAAIGAKVDGIAGYETLSKLVTVSKSINRRHAVVRPLQKYLNTLGYSCGTVDGIAGNQFDNAAKAWAKANGCVADGEFTKGGKSWKRILGVI